MYIEAESWLDEIDDEGESPLTRAIKSGNYSLTQLVCNYEERLATGKSIACAVQRAAYEGRDSDLELLIQNGTDPDVCDEDGDTPLHKAVRQGHLTTVITLLHNGAIPNIRDGLGLAPLHWAVLKGNAEIAQLLMQFGADVNVRDSFSAMTPFTYARLLNYKQLARLLGRYGGTW